jgi:hypothetical protein
LVQQAIDYFTALGWEVVGDPGLIHPNWNGADLVFTAADGSGRVLAVELKDVAGMVDLGTLGKSGGDYGGSIDRLARQSERLYNSSQDQLKLMCQTVSDAYKNGKLENALFTSAEKVSTKAQDIFKGVYRVSPDGKVSVDKNLEKVSALGAAWQALKHWTVATGKTVQRTIIDPIIIWPNPMWVMEELHRQDPDNPAYFPYWRAGEPPIG